VKGAELFKGDAGPFLDGPVHEDEPALHVQDEDALVDIFQDRAQADAETVQYVEWVHGDGFLPAGDKK
jgi:hypothetical protein